MTIFNYPSFTLKEKKGLFASSDFAFACEADRKAAIEYAEKALTFEIPVLPATLYMEYARNGNRSNYEGPYFQRRDNLRALLLGTLASGDDRYIDKIIDLVWAISEETSWVIPAHNVAHPYRLAGEPLPDAFADDIIEIDLFSAETASLLTWVYHYTKEKLDAVSPVIAKRIEYEIHRRILKPYLRLEMRWMANFINNWTPWIVSNVLTCAAIFLKEWHELQMVINVSTAYLDRFAMTYGEDGGCNEGASYWTAAVAALFDTICILDDITGGTLNAFDSPLLHRMCEYFPDVCIDAEEKLFFNFADCPRHVTADRKLLYRMGKKLGSEKLIRFAQTYNVTATFIPARNMIYRTLMGLSETIPEENASALQKKDAIYPDLQLAVLRRGELSFAVKGGHNRESHNHNDIGSFILYNGTTPVIVDAGVGVYTKDTFSDKRYTIWTMQSSYHNLPEIDGMMQLPGREYRADAFEATDDSVFVSYKSAYPRELSAESVTRKITTENDTITIFDEVKGANTVTYHLLTAEEPQKIDGGFAVGGCHILLDGEWSFEAIDISYDNNLKRDWAQDTLYRVKIASAGTLKTTIRKA